MLRGKRHILTLYKVRCCYSKCREIEMSFIKFTTFNILFLMLSVVSTVAGDNLILESQITVEEGSSDKLIPLSTEHCWSSSSEKTSTAHMIWRDIDLDGYIDGCFITNRFISLNLFKLGQQYENASWYGAWNGSSSNYFTGGSIGDVDDDGFPDFVVCTGGWIWWFPEHSASKSSTYIYFSNKGLPERWATWSSASTYYSNACDLGDYDNDGDLDLVCATGVDTLLVSYNDLIYQNNDGAMTGFPVWTSATMTSANDIVWGDIDNDGDLDLVAAVRGFGAITYENLNGAMDTIGDYSSFNSGNVKKVVLGDLNNDNFLDVVVGYNENNGRQGYTQVYINDGTGSFKTDESYLSYTRKGIKGLALYDYDFDNDLDLAICQERDSTLVFENLDGKISKDAIWGVRSTNKASSVVWADIDGEGVENFVEEIRIDANKKLYYTELMPLYSIDSVQVDGKMLSHNEYCFSLLTGWVSLKETPDSELLVFYKYSYTNDLVVSNEDSLNFAFQNLVKPNISFTATQLKGNAPFSTTFKSDTHRYGNRSWSFGDGELSRKKEPTHVYDSVGIYNVTFDIKMKNIKRSHTDYSMIIITADTLKGNKVFGKIGDTVEVEISMRNQYYAREIIIPVSYDGDLGLTPLSISAEGCRTEYFETVQLWHVDDLEKKLTLRLSYSTGLPVAYLPPGDGLVAKIRFIVVENGVNGSATTYNFDGYSIYQPTIYSVLFSYNLASKAGLVSTSCCENLRGNVDGDLEDKVSITDILHLSMFIFKQPRKVTLNCFDEADLTGDNKVDISDIVSLVQYVFFMDENLEVKSCP